MLQGYVMVNCEQMKRKSEVKGKYDYRDQKFPDKVLKYYSVIDINNGNLSGSAQQLLTEAMGSWPSNMDERRKAVIEKGVSLYGKVTYSMDQRLQPSMDNPRYLDCSSFVGWSFYYAWIKKMFFPTGLRVIL